MITRTTWLPILFALVIYLPVSSQSFDLYISDAGNFNNPPWKILKFDENGGNGQVFTTENLAWPQDIVFLEDQNIALISNLNTGIITRHNAETGAYIDNFATGIAGPTRMEIGPDSLLYVLPWQGTNKVRRFELTGNYVGEFTSQGINASIGIAWDAVGNMYVSSFYGKFVNKFSPMGADLGKIISTNLVGPTNIWVADNGDLLVVDYSGGAVKRFDHNGNYIGVFIPNIAQGEGVDFLPNGNLIIGSGGSSAIKLYDADGNFIKDLVPAGQLGLKTPNAVVLRPKSLSSVTEQFKQVDFIVPNFGTNFQISRPANMDTTQMAFIYNSTGRLAKTIKLTKNSNWNASGAPDGVYYVTVKLMDGSTARQKIVVQH